MKLSSLSHDRQSAAPDSGALRPFWPLLLAGLLILLYVVTFTWLAVSRHNSFDSGGFDLGVYDQVVWNTLHGRIFFYTTTGQPLLHLSNHADPILLLLAPFYLIHSGPETLLLLQALVIGLGGLPVFWLAWQKLKSSVVALCLLAAYLLYPPLQVATLSDFHPPALAVGFLLFAFYFLVRRNLWGTLIFAVLAMACKEQIPLVVFLMGLFAFFYYRQRKMGLILGGLAVVWFLVVMYWVIPAFSVTGGHIFLDYYADLGSSPGEIIVTAVTRPDLVIRNLWQPAKLQYLRDILAPFAFLPLLGLPVLLIGSPAFAINLLSAKSAMYDATQGHYSADLAPWVVLAAIYGLGYFRNVAGRWWPPVQQRVTLVAGLLLLAVSLVWQLFYGFSPLAFNAPHWTVSAHDRLAQRFLDQIPADASVAAQGELYPHLSDREFAYHLPSINDAEYVFVDVASTTQSIHPSDLRRLVKGLLESGEYGVLDGADGYLLLQRGLSNSQLPDAFFDFARVDPAALAPQYRLQIDFGDQLRLLGFDVIYHPRQQATSVRLYWQALRPPDDRLRPYPFFLNPEGDLIEDTSSRPLVTQLWYPPRMWQPGEIVVTQTIPWQLGDTWSLAVGVLNGSEWSDWEQRLPISAIEATGDLSPRPFDARTWARLVTFERQGSTLVLVPVVEDNLQADFVAAADFGDRMALQGYDLSSETALPGQQLVVTLYWQALAPMAVDYTVYVHLVAADGQLVAQHDGQPWWEVPIPTSSWTPGETLRDAHPLDLPAELPPGTYRLEVGVYYWQTMERLPVIQDGSPQADSVTLGELQVE